MIPFSLNIMDIEESRSVSYRIHVHGWLRHLLKYPSFGLRRLVEALAMMFAANGDGAAVEKRHAVFEAVMRNNGRLITGICLSFAGSREDFEDLRQDVLLNVWRGIDGCRGDSAESTWIYRVALNTCVSFQRKKKRREDVSLRDLYEELYDNSTADEIDRYRLIYSLLGKLKPIDRSVMLMMLDGKSHNEIADVVGISRNAVTLRIKRAKKSLAEMYKASASDYEL